MVIMIILTLFLLNRLNFGNQWINSLRESDAAYVSGVVALKHGRLTFLLVNRRRFTIPIRPNNKVTIRDLTIYMYMVNHMAYIWRYLNPNQNVTWPSYHARYVSRCIWRKCPIQKIYLFSFSLRIQMLHVTKWTTYSKTPIGNLLCCRKWERMRWRSDAMSAIYWWFFSNFR